MKTALDGPAAAVPAGHHGQFGNDEGRAIIAEIGHLKCWLWTVSELYLPQASS